MALSDVGYVYKLPEWKKYARTLKRIEGDYFLYILYTLESRRSNFNEPDLIEVMEESLDSLKKHNIKTVFKPHSITNMGKLKDLLNRVNYKNYLIDYSHPYALCLNARFVFANYFSGVMMLAYYLGKPTVEYSQYDPELLKRLGGSVGGEFCDFFINRDKKELERVLDKVMNNGFVTRDLHFIHNTFKDTPKEFYDFWRKLLWINPTGID